MFVVVTGAPASGKTTVSRLLADELRLTRLAKDTIKGGLLKVLPADDVQASRRIGAAAVQALLALAAENQACVLDSVWVRDDSVEALRRLPGPVVEVFCACELQELRRRYRERASQRSGREDDFDLARPEDELWNDRSLRPLAGGWPVLTVNTEVPVDIRALASSVLAAAAPEVDVPEGAATARSRHEGAVVGAGRPGTDDPRGADGCEAEPCSTGSRP